MTDKQIDEALEAVDTIQEETTEYALGVTRSRYQHEINTIRQTLERQRAIEARTQRALDHYTATSELHTSWEQCAGNMAACLREDVPSDG